MGYLLFSGCKNRFFSLKYREQIAKMRELFVKNHTKCSFFLKNITIFAPYNLIIKKKKMKTFKLIILLFLACISIQAQEFPYRTTLAAEPYPAEQIRCIFFDKEGLLWIGTNNGLKSYDGYTYKTYKADVYSPSIFPNNTILCIKEDNHDNLWLGTRDGLVRMNKRTGKFQTYHLPNDTQRIIYTLYIAKNGTLWIGTDGGLSYYHEQTNKFYTYDEKSWAISPEGKKKRIGSFGVKAILEDKNGDFLIGTWSNGLMRFNIKKKLFLQYPQFNQRNSAYSLFFDRRHRLWVGTWGYGVVRMDDPNNVKHPKIHQYPYRTCYFDTYYKIIEDPISKNLWGCTREGVSIINPNQEDAQWDNYTHIGEYKLKFNNDLAADNKGRIWLSTLTNGILQAHTIPSPFKNWNISKSDFNINYISSLFTNDGIYFWIGLNPYGVALYNRNTHATLYNQEIPGFANLSDNTLSTSISSIVQRSNGELWLANNSYGVIVKKPHQEAYNLMVGNTNYIKDNYINTLFESKDKTMWIGQRGGLSIVYPNNKGVFLQMSEGNSDFSKADVRHIYQDKRGNIWLATDNDGIIRISGNVKKPKSLLFHQYNPSHNNLAIDDATACLEDCKGRLWAISNSGGLLLYNKEKDCFEPKNREFHILGNNALSILEDRLGNLWLTNDNSLVNIVWSKDGSKPEKILYFGKEDGLDDLVFTQNSNCKYQNEFFIGSRNNFYSFNPTQINDDSYQHTSNLIITDLMIDDMPFSRLDSLMKKQISKEMPTFSRRFIIPSSIKKFSLAFSLLTYSSTKKSTYAYKLEGYDQDWHYMNGESHQVTFQNLPSGTYQLHLKASDGYGLWEELPYTITIKVLPPWYASRLAFMLYILLFIGAVFATAKWYKEHLKTKSRLQMGVFLTNITHELLTPLTVISATIYKLKDTAPQYDEDFQVIDHNINRTTRLLRQILEVRKSQAGQLKLLVNRGNLSIFILNICESIRPMAIHRGISLELNVTQNDVFAWFDPDKLEKILNNLLSNAIKYNKEEGKICLSLTLSKDKATISITDNGIGMSKEKMKHLYTRFFDGDYRKQNITGTGIGLSLTYDLVKLHHGNIKCESAEGKGTTFTVTIPINKSAYAAQEIDTSNINQQVNNQTIQLASQEEKELAKKSVHHAIFVRKNVNKILVVEDNEELLNLMQQMLSKKFHVLTAKNGKQAMNSIMKEQLDLVVSDVMMPVMDGIELTKRIKEDKSFWQLPIILLTAKNKESDATEGYATGADAYITKPFKFEDLIVRIETLISNRKKIREKIIKEQKTTDAQEEESSYHYSNPDKAFIEKATELVLQHLDDAEYNRDTFAKDMALGSSTLYNKVKATTGQTVVGFINSIRLKEAKCILKSDPNILINDLATRVGFNTPKYFSKCFKNEFGIYPKEFADQLKKCTD